MIVIPVPLWLVFVWIVTSIVTIYVIVHHLIKAIRKLFEIVINLFLDGLYKIKSVFKKKEKTSNKSHNNGCSNTEMRTQSDFGGVSDIGTTTTKSNPQYLQSNTEPLLPLNETSNGNQCNQQFFREEPQMQQSSHINENAIKAKQSASTSNINQKPQNLTAGKELILNMNSINLQYGNSIYNWEKIISDRYRVEKYINVQGNGSYTLDDTCTNPMQFLVAVIIKDDKYFVIPFPGHMRHCEKFYQGFKMATSKFKYIKLSTITSLGNSVISIKQKGEVVPDTIDN